MLSMIDGMLDLGSILSNNFIRKLSTFNLSETIYEVKDIIDPKNKRSANIEFYVHISERVPTCNVFLDFLTL